ncbi:MAG: phosphotransferase [Gemmataceae bacterium]|nr:phosphotransferase [Gemmataceae bacterium]
MLALADAPPEVLGRYPALDGCAAQFLGNRGGFSGARLWRVESAAGAFCLKAWPTNDHSVVSLAWIHELLDRARRHGVDFVTSVLPTSTGVSAVEHGGRVWDVSSWLPGDANFHEHSRPARLNAATAALARLHGAWQDLAPRTGPCPAVRRRLETLRGWRALVAAGWRPAIAADDPARPMAEQAWRLLPDRAPEIERSLEPWRDVRLRLHPCWCDPWHDHVLFSGDRVSGLIDYGSVKEDHAAVDLARLLGSLAGDDYAAWDSAFAAYRTVRPLTEQEQALVAVLERAGVITAVVTWLRWLYHERRDFENRATIAFRLQSLVTRLDNQSANHYRLRLAGNSTCRT